MKSLIVACVALTISTAAHAQYLGQYSANPYAGIPAPPQPANPYGNSMNSPGLYTNQGQFRGNLNTNQFDPNSVANPYGRYGSQYSPNSINNPYGAGSPYNPQSPTNPYGQGLGVYRR